jgi:uncharacterized protein (TIGR02231 family)
MRRLTLLLSLVPPAVLLLTVPALAELTAVSAVTRVTVFPDGARVTREAVLRIPAGDPVVVFPDLPAAAPPDSLQVTGSGDAPLTIVQVESGQDFLEGPAPEREAALADALQKLLDRRREVDDRKSALQKQLAFIDSVAKVAPPKTKEGLLVGAPGDWPAAWTSIGKGAEATYAAIRAQDLAARDLDKRIDKARRELNRVRTGATRRLAVRVHLKAEADGNARLAVTYQVPGASWSPVYDARLDTEAAALALELHADVRQKTGEDWTDALLTLSTARPTAGAAMPEPVPWFIGTAPVPRSQGVLRAPAAPEELAKSQGFMLQLDEVAAVPAKEETAETVSGEFALSYRVAGPRTVPADGEPHRFAAEVRDLAVKLAVRANPQQEERAYLYAVLTNDGAALPAGPVNLFREGTLVGRTAFTSLPTGDEQRLPFGPDDRVTVTQKVDKDLSGKRGLFGKVRRVERRRVIEVTSFHTQPVEITVYDRLPVPRQDPIEVKYLDSWATPPTTTDWEGLKGVIAWSERYEPKEKREIHVGYTVTYPDGWNVPGF